MCYYKELQSTDVTGERIRRVLERISEDIHMKPQKNSTLPEDT